MNPLVYPILSASAALTALVGTRITPITAPQDTARPYVVFTPTGVSTEKYFNDPESVDYDRVSIDCYSSTFGEADAIAKAARAALATTGYLASGLTDYEEETKLFRVSFDWSFVTLT